jgi:hypothetical protein
VERRDHSGQGVTFPEAARDEAYGTVAVFENLYGNRWDLLRSRATGVTRAPG